MSLIATIFLVNVRKTEKPTHGLTRENKNDWQFSWMARDDINTASNHTNDCKNITRADERHATSRYGPAGVAGLIFISYALCRQ